MQPAYGRLADPQELVFGWSALEVYGIGDLHERRHEFAVRRPRRTRLASVALQHRRWEPGDWRIEEYMAVARSEWVIVEGICAGEDGDHMAAAVADARHRGLIDEEYLRRHLESLGRVRARAVAVIVA